MQSEMKWNKNVDVFLSYLTGSENVMNDLGRINFFDNWQTVQIVELNENETITDNFE